MADPNDKTKAEQDVLVRVTRVEEGYDSLRREVHALGDAVRIQGESLSRDLRSISDKVSAKSETDWATFFRGGSLLLAFVLAIGSAALSPLYFMSGTNSSRTDLLEERFRTHEQLPGHPTAMALHTQTANSLDSLDHRVKGEEQTRRTEERHRELIQVIKALVHPPEKSKAE